VPAVASKVTRLVQTPAAASASSLLVTAVSALTLVPV
jgi:hypothetical protein